MRSQNLHIYRTLLSFCTLALLFSTWVPAALSQEDDDDSDDAADSRPPAPALKVQAERFVTWWFHDALGYHPAILIVVRNVSGRDLSGIPVKLQAQFTNARNGHVSVAREEVRQIFEDNREFQVFLKSPRAYELPIDQSLWPNLDCKVMCRVGDTGNEPTQMLIRSVKLEAITMSPDDAHTLLQKGPSTIRRPIVPLPTRPEKPLVAMAGSLTHAAKPRKSIDEFVSSTTMPGLGDDFYQFEKKFGLPTETDLGEPDWVWASYHNADPDMTVIVGSQGRSGKADMIVLSVPKSQIKGESQLIELARTITGKFRTESHTPTDHSVRYLPAGRLEYGSFQAKNYRAAFFAPGEAPASGTAFTVVVTRIPGNLLELLNKRTKKAKLLRFLAPMTGVEGT